MRKKRSLMGVFGLFLILCMAVGVTGYHVAFVDVQPAYAHSTTVKVSAACNKATGQYDVTFKISSDFNLWATVISMNPNLATMPTNVPPKGSVSTMISVPGNTSGNVSLSATLRWTDGHTDSDSDSTNLSGNCVANTATPTRTITPVPASVLVCHKAGNSGNYTVNNISVHSVSDANGLNGHGNHSGDVWAPFTFNGVNYDGQGDWWNFNGQCQVTTPTPTASSTATATLIPTNTSTATLVPTNTSTSTSTDEPTATLTATPVDPDTATPTDQPTETLEPSATPEDPTATPVDPTNTPEDPTATPGDPGCDGDCLPTSTPIITSTPEDPGGSGKSCREYLALHPAAVVPKHCLGGKEVADGIVLAIQEGTIQSKDGVGLLAYSLENGFIDRSQWAAAIAQLIKGGYISGAQGGLTPRN